MKLKYFKQLSLAGILTVTGLAGCQKDLDLPTAMEEKDTELVRSAFDARMVDITEHYDYYGEQFSVTYTLDQETDEIVEARGDLEQAEAILSGDDFPQGRIVTVGNMDLDPSSKIQLFDTEEEAIQAWERSSTASKNCNYHEDPGVGTYRFYHHNSYGSEMQDLTKIGIRSLGWNNVMPHNNDQISSIKGEGPHIIKNTEVSVNPWDVPSITLHNDICYGGASDYVLGTHTEEYLGFSNGIGTYRYRFNLRIPNLSAISVYLGYWQGWSNWNDRISSVTCFWPDF